MNRSGPWAHPPRRRKSHWHIHALFWACMAIAIPVLIYQILGAI